MGMDYHYEYEGILKEKGRKYDKLAMRNDKLEEVLELVTEIRWDIRWKIVRGTQECSVCEGFERDHHLDGCDMKRLQDLLDELDEVEEKE